MKKHHLNSHFFLSFFLSFWSFWLTRQIWWWIEQSCLFHNYPSKMLLKNMKSPVIFWHILSLIYHAHMINLFGIFWPYTVLKSSEDTQISCTEKLFFKRIKQACFWFLFMLFRSAAVEFKNVVQWITVACLYTVISGQ